MNNRFSNGSNSNLNHSAMAQTMDQANLMAMDQLADSTTSLLESTKRIHSNLKDQNMRINAMVLNSMDADDGMSKGRKLAKDIIDDPTGVGICKIAMIVFITLCVVYFGGKYTYKLLKFILK